MLALRRLARRPVRGGGGGGGGGGARRALGARRAGRDDGLPEYSLRGMDLEQMNLEQKMAAVQEKIQEEKRRGGRGFWGGGGGEGESAPRRWLRLSLRAALMLVFGLSMEDAALRTWCREQDAGRYEVSPEERELRRLARHRERRARAAGAGARASAEAELEAGLAAVARPPGTLPEGAARPPPEDGLDRRAARQPTREDADKAPRGARVARDTAVVTITDPVTGRLVVLIGTTHSSPDSAKVVRHHMRSLQPDNVVVELCAERAAPIMDAAGRLSVDSFVLQRRGPLRFLANQASVVLAAAVTAAQGGGYAAAFMLAAGMRAQWGALLGRPQGIDMFVALQEAAWQGAGVLHADQTTAETDARLQEMIGSAVAGGGGMGLLTGSGDGGASALRSAAVKALTESRDELLADRISRCPGSRVVAVVGLSHLEGVRRSILSPPPRV